MAEIATKHVDAFVDVSLDSKKLILLEEKPLSIKL